MLPRSTFVEISSVTGTLKQLMCLDGQITAQVTCSIDAHDTWDAVRCRSWCFHRSSATRWHIQTLFRVPLLIFANA